MDLKNKNILYFGGFGGIGQKCIPEFLKKQVANIIIFDLKENTQVLSEWRKAYPSTELQYISVDVTKSETIEKAYELAIEKLKMIDVVVNGFGLMDDSHLDLTIDINLSGVIHSCMIALRYMDKAKGGRGGCIANISSVAGIETSGMFAIYSAAKHGVTAFSRAMTNPLYFANTGVNFITICPGLTETALLENLENKTTLREYSDFMVKRFATIVRQSADVCAANIITVIETNKLGSVWILDKGEIAECEMPTLWKATIKQ